jgi:TetR/AcrR family transcriptional regulator
MTQPGKRKPSRRSRGAGRPRGDDGDLRARLLDAATSQYARLGIDGTSLRAIASEAGVTPAMLHYYFGDKPRLTQAMIEERLLPALEPVRGRLEQAGDDPAALAEAFACGIGELVTRHPWLPPLWVREVLCEGGALREVLFHRALPNVPRLLAQRFAAAQAEGRINPELDPRLLVVSLVGLTLFPAAGAPIWRAVFDAEDIDAGAMLKHTLALLRGGLGTTGSGAAP